MSYVIDTRVNKERNWFAVIDTEKSRVVPVPREFTTREEAEEWAAVNLEKVEEDNIRYREL